MSIYKQESFKPINVFWLIIVLALILFGLFYLAKGVFTVLTWIAPVLLIATAFINYRIITDYFKMIWAQLQSRPFLGAGLILFTIFGFPLVAGYLFFKAFLHRKVDRLHKEVKKRKEGEYVDYEVVQNRALELPPLEDDSISEYEKLFDEDENSHP